MAFLGLKVVAAIAKGVKNLASKIKDKKEAKLQKKVDAAVEKQGKLNSIFGSAGVSLPAGNPIKNAAENLMGIKPEVAEGVDAVPGGGGGKELPAWLVPVAIGGALLLFLPKLLGRKRR